MMVDEYDMPWWSPSPIFFKIKNKKLSIFLNFLNLYDGSAIGWIERKIKFKICPIFIFTSYSHLVSFFEGGGVCMSVSGTQPKTFMLNLLNFVKITKSTTVNFFNSWYSLQCFESKLALLVSIIHIIYASIPWGYLLPYF